MQIRTLLAGVAMTAALAGCATSGSQAPDSQKPAAQKFVIDPHGQLS